MKHLPGLKPDDRFSTILADPPWRFQNRTGKVAPEHQRLNRYSTMTLQEICDLPVAAHAADSSHLYLWSPNALLPDALQVLEAWGFTYKSNLIWHKIRRDGGSDGRGAGFYFRNVLPRIGQLLASNDQQAYAYLPESVGQFPSGAALAERMRGVGLREVRYTPLTFGIATLYVGNK